MSFRSLQDHLEDMREAIVLVEQFTSGKNFDDYQHNTMMRKAVERELQIISEVAYRLGDDAPQVDPGHDWKALRSLGNVLRHAYHRIDDAMLWHVVTTDLPVLKRSVLEALKQYD